jgi:hypothetical protein
VIPQVFGKLFPVYSPLFPERFWDAKQVLLRETCRSRTQIGFFYSGSGSDGAFLGTSRGGIVGERCCAYP